MDIVVGFFVANFIRFLAVQKFRKSVKIWQSYREFKSGNFFETQCSCLMKSDIIISSFSCLRWRCRHSVVTEDTPFFLLSFLFFFVLFLFLPVFHQDARAPPSWKQARLNWNFNTLYRMVSVRRRLLFSSNLTTLLEVLGHQTFHAAANICYSSKLFIALSLQDHDAFMAQPISLQLFGRWCVFFGAAISTRSSHTRVSFH